MSLRAPEPYFALLHTPDDKAKTGDWMNADKRKLFYMQSDH